MDALLLVPIVLPILTGCLCLGIRNRTVRNSLATIGMLLTLFVGIFLFFVEELRFSAPWISLSIFDIDFELTADPLNRIIALGCTFFGLIFLSYVIKQLGSHGSLKMMQCSFLWMVGIANGAVLANNLLVAMNGTGVLSTSLLQKQSNCS